MSLIQSYSESYIFPTEKFISEKVGGNGPPLLRGPCIYSQAIRYRRIITQDEELDFHLENLFSSLVSKGYDPTLIQSVFSKERTQSQTDLLKEKDTPNKGILPFVIPFNTNTKSIGLILNKHWRTIMKDIPLNPIHQEKPIMAFKRNRNITDILVHTKL